MSRIRNFGIANVAVVLLMWMCILWDYKQRSAYLDLACQLATLVAQHNDNFQRPYTTPKQIEIQPPSFWSNARVAFPIKDWEAGLPEEFRNEPLVMNFEGTRLIADQIPEPDFRYIRTTNLDSFKEELKNTFVDSDLILQMLLVSGSPLLVFFAFLLFASFGGLVIAKPLFARRKFRYEPTSAFVLMPFGTAWSDGIFESIKKALDQVNVSCRRADEITDYNVLENIWTGINESGIIIADLTGRNPNVFHELGIALTLGRRLILLSQESADTLPFDVRTYRVISYDCGEEGQTELKLQLIDIFKSGKAPRVQQLS